MVDSPLESPVEGVERVLAVLRIANNINLACIVVIYYDWITILNTEIELIWKAKWSTLTVSYLSARYLTLVYCPLILYYQFDHSLSVSSCTKLYSVILLTTAVAVVCAAPILTIRTVAVWERGKFITYFAFGFLAVSTVCLLLFSILSLKHTDHTKPLEIAGSVGCVQMNQSYHLSAVFVTGTVFDTVNLGLVLARGTSLLWWGRNSRLFRTIYADGILFHVYMSSISITNLVFMFSSNEFQTILVMVPGALRTLLATRVVLHIRMHHYKPPLIGMSENTLTAHQTKLSVIEFRTV